MFVHKTKIGLIRILTDIFVLTMITSSIILLHCKSIFLLENPSPVTSQNIIRSFLARPVSPESFQYGLPLQSWLCRNHRVCSNVLQRNSHILQILGSEPAGTKLEKILCLFIHCAHIAGYLDSFLHVAANLYGR